MAISPLPAHGAAWDTWAADIDAAARAGIGGGGGGSTLAVAATVSASGTLLTGKHNPVNATSGTRAMSLPTGAAAGTLLAVEKTDASTNTVTIAGNVRGATGTTLTLFWQNEALLFAADTSGSWWPIAGHKTKASLDATYVAKVDAIDLESTQDSVAGMFTGGTHTGISFTYNDPGNVINATVTGAAVVDATTTAKGLVQLAGDLAGTAAAPTIAKIGGAPILLSDTRPGSPATGLVRIGLAATGSPDTTAPTVPTSLTVTPGNTQNVLSWTASTDAVGVTGYRVRRGGTLIASPAATTYTDTGLTNGTTYSYTVSAVDAAANESAQTSAVTGTPTAGATAPAQVTGLTAGTPTATGVPLSWTAPANGGSAITDYVIQYRTTAGPGAWNTFADGTSTTASTTVTGLTASTGYDFQVAAVNAIGSGAYSATASATTAASGGGGATGTDPTTVSGLSALWSADSLALSNGAEVISLPASAGSATGSTFTQTAGFGPSFVTATQNGLPVIRNSGTRGLATGTLSTALGGTDTSFVVGKFAASVTNAILFGASTGGGNYGLSGWNPNQLTFFNGSNFTTITTLPNATSWHVFAVRRNGTTSGGLQLWVDGTPFASTTATTITTAPGLTLFGKVGSDTQATGDIGAAAVYAATALSDADILGITRWFGAKWGVTVA